MKAECRGHHNLNQQGSPVSPVRLQTSRSEQNNLRRGCKDSHEFGNNSQRRQRGNHDMVLSTNSGNPICHSPYHEHPKMGLLSLGNFKPLYPQFPFHFLSYYSCDSALLEVIHPRNLRMRSLPAIRICFEF